MIKVLGIRRIFVLLGLVSINVLLGASLYMYLLPEKINVDRNVKRVRAEIGKLSTDINNIQIELNQLQGQQAEFDSLKLRGFFDNQSRRNAQDVLKRIQERSNVISAVANIQPGVVEPHEETEKTGYSILMSPVSIEVKSIDDIAIFKYLDLLQKEFPGHVSVVNLNIERTSNITGVILRGIASGQNPPLVKAQINVLWRTMIPDSDVIDVGGSR